MLRRFRSGNRRLNRRLGHRLGRYVTRRLDGRAFRPPNHLAEVCRLLSRCVRWRQRAARRDPHLFGPHASRYYADTVRRVHEQETIHAALEKVYGPAPPGEAWRPDSIWWERYHVAPGQEKLFRKWFQEQYGR